MNQDLMRDILLFLEKEADGKRPFSPDTIKNSLEKEYSHDEIFYHLKLLYYGGFIILETMYDRTITVLMPTPDGHRFIEIVREKSSWEKFKQNIGICNTANVFSIIQSIEGITRFNLGY